MNHEHVTERLDDYVAGRLTEADQSSVEEHLAGCAECTRELRAHEPVDLADLQLPLDDGEGIRRTVRRALGRTAIDAAALAVIILVGGVLLSLFVVQPLLINRSDRAAVAARAAYEAPMLFNPGVEVSRFTISSGLIGRTIDVEVGIPLGSSIETLPSISSGIGILSVDPQWRSSLPGPLIPLSDVIPGLDPGTVLTVSFGLPEPLTIEAAQQLADEPGQDVRLTWAGFDVQSSIFGQVGYPLCRTLDTPSADLFGASSASVGGTPMSGPPSVQKALASARDALATIASNDEVSGSDSGHVADLASAMTEERSVTSFVVTGPSPEVASFLDDLGVAEGQVLAVGFYSWGSPVCGR
jgi:hypothetical protein